MTELQISHSELRCWRTCHRQWYVRYYLEYDAGPDAAPVGAASLGTRIHMALEGRYGYGLDAIRVLHYLYDEAVAGRPDFAHDLDLERGYAIAMTEGFLQWAADEGIDAGYEVLATEHEEQAEITLPSGEKVLFRGRLDQLVRREHDGAILFRDWKTTGSLAKANSLLLDTQMRFYSMLQALNTGEGQRADGGLYLMLLRSKRTDRAKGPFFDQIEVRYNANDLNSMWLHARAIAQEIVDARRKLDAGGDHREIVYASPGDYCRWGCPFVTMCHLMDDGSRWEDALKANYSHCDPYERYTSDKMLHIREALG